MIGIAHVLFERQEAGARIRLEDFIADQMELDHATREQCSHTPCFCPADKYQAGRRGADRVCIDPADSCQL